MTHVQSPLRFSVDEVIGDDGITFDNEGREVVEMLAELPDLWDVNVSDFSNDALTSRFGEEGLARALRFLRQESHDQTRRRGRPIYFA